MPATRRPRLGLIVNPLAGIGGRLAARGSDLFEDLQAAVIRGGEPVAQSRAIRALQRLRSRCDDIDVLTVSGAMGEEASRLCGFSPKIVHHTGDRTTTEDTTTAARALLQQGIDLLLFAGGDGTARDVFSVVAAMVPILGIPTGVKMQSAVFGLSPEAAGDVAAAWLDNPTRTERAEIMDADEAELAAGRPSMRLHGYARAPVSTALMQAAKGSRPDGGEAGIAALGRLLARDTPPERLVLIGPGTTMQLIKRGFGFEGSLLGVDAVAGGELVARDADAATLEALCERFSEITLFVGVIGNQGFVFGRGNQQISPSVIRRIGRGNIRVIATREKLVGLGTTTRNSQALPPSALPGISPSRGEISKTPSPRQEQKPRADRAKTDQLHFNCTSTEGATPKACGTVPHPISPLEGEMSGRTEGGEAGAEHRNDLWSEERAATSGEFPISSGARPPSPTLHIDTGDPALDAELCGYHRILTGPGETMVMRLSAAS